jgi:hypothetical protein
MFQNKEERLLIHGQTFFRLHNSLVQTMLVLTRCGSRQSKCQDVLTTL